jgi:hypothetical protein
VKDEKGKNRCDLVYHLTSFVIKPAGCRFKTKAKTFFHVNLFIYSRKPERKEEFILFEISKT